MPNIVGVRFERSGRVHYCDPANHDLSVGETVLVDTDDGPKEGRVVIAASQVLHSDLRGPMSVVLTKVEQ